MLILRTIILLGISVPCLGVKRMKVEIGDRNANSAARPNIVGGVTATKNGYPWQVAIKYGSQFICGGSIIHSSLILTAGHCVDFDPTQTKQSFSVVAGDHYTNTNESTEQTSLVSRIVLHANYDDIELFNDIALMHLKTPLTFTTSVQPTKLSTSAFDASALRRKNCYVSGFGVYTQGSFDSLPSTLQELQVQFISNKKCDRLLRKYRFSTSSSMICTSNGASGICSGDSGGPVGCFNKKLNKFKQVGIVSWGPRAACNVPPAVYTRVSDYTDWIKHNSV